jgi:oligoendopeptidase F
MTTTPPVTWDLSDLFTAVDDPRIEAELAALEERARLFAERCRGQLATLTPAEFGAAIAEYEAIERAAQFPAAYAGLLFAADTQTPAHGALLQRVQERGVAISRHLLFFTLELIAIPDERFALLLDEPLVARYRHWLQHERAARPHRLSEAEEHILLEKSTTGRDAFSRLFDESAAHNSP